MHELQYAAMRDHRSHARPRANRAARTLAAPFQQLGSFRRALAPNLAERPRLAAALAHAGAQPEGRHALPPRVGQAVAADIARRPAPALLAAALAFAAQAHAAPLALAALAGHARVDWPAALGLALVAGRGLAAAHMGLPPAGWPARHMDWPQSRQQWLAQFAAHLAQRALGNLTEPEVSVARLSCHVFPFKSV